MTDMFYRFASEVPFDGKVMFDGSKAFGYETCYKCSGQGRIVYFAHHNQGICFTCHGDKVTRFRLYSEKQVASQLRRIAKADQEAEARAHINIEINKVHGLRSSVRQGFWNIEKIRTRAGSNHVGDIGQRIIIDGTVENTVSFDGFYGTTYMTVIKDTDGNVYVYKGSRRIAKKGETVNLKATVKDHSEYNGVKQTVINRPKII